MQHEAGDTFAAIAGAITAVASNLLGLVEANAFEFYAFAVTMSYGAAGALGGWAAKKLLDYITSIIKSKKKNGSTS